MKPEWVSEKGVIDEVSFCQEMLYLRPIYYRGGNFYTLDGPLGDEELRAQIFETISPYVTTNLSIKVDKIVKALKMMAYTKPPAITEKVIYFRNGTYYVGKELIMEDCFSPIRLNVNYNENAPEPSTWLLFLEDLLEQEDILTLQEYLGYCLLPTNKAQKMLMIIGSGGEGKSQIGHVMKGIFGSAMTSCSIQKVEHNRFSRADLENKLLMVDDDMDLNALQKTNYIKSIITAEEAMDVERKGIQSYQARLYARFLCFGNGALTALYDRSDGFFRRQIVLTAKKKDPQRIDEPYLKEILLLEKEGILMWMMEGLFRLIGQDFRFTLSRKTRENMLAQQRQGNNMLQFLESEGYLRFSPTASASTRGLYECYRRWCDDNAEHPFSMTTFASSLAQNAYKFRLTPTNTIFLPGQRRCRGYIGLSIL